MHYGFLLLVQVIGRGCRCSGLSPLVPLVAAPLKIRRHFLKKEGDLFFHRKAVLGTLNKLVRHLSPPVATQNSKFPNFGNSNLSDFKYQISNISNFQISKFSNSPIPKFHSPKSPIPRALSDSTSGLRKPTVWGPRWPVIFKKWS